MILSARSALLLGIIVALSAPAAVAAAAAGFDFALIGDYPYFPRDDPGMSRLVREIREDPTVRFVVHLGDFHNPRSTLCSEPHFRSRFEMLSGLGHPFVLTPGDNDWADCEGDPQAHLAAVRRIFFADPTRSNGAPAFPVRPQSAGDGFPDFVENAIWEREGVVFATLHMVLPNAFSVFDPNARAKEQLIAAAEAWIDEVFARARETDARGVFLATQANLWMISGTPTILNLVYPELVDQAPAFEGVKRSLVRHVRAFGRPVVLANGDSHYFRIDKPLVDAKLDMLETFTRVEGFGSPHGHWVRVTVEPERPEVFRFRQELVAGNLFTLIPPDERDETGGDPGPADLLVVFRVFQALVWAFTWIGAFTVAFWIVMGVRRLRRGRAR